MSDPTPTGGEPDGGLRALSTGGFVLASALLFGVCLNPDNMIASQPKHVAAILLAVTLPFFGLCAIVDRSQSHERISARARGILLVVNALAAVLAFTVIVTLCFSASVWIGMALVVSTIIALPVVIGAYSDIGRV